MHILKNIVWVLRLHLYLTHHGNNFCRISERYKHPMSSTIHLNEQSFLVMHVCTKVDFDIEATPTRSGQTTIVVRFSNCFEWPMMTMILINHIFSRQSSIPMSCRISLVLGKCQSSLDKEEITFISNLTALPSHQHAHLIEK